MRTTVLAKCLSGLAASLVLAALACNQGSEGDRCNPITAANGHDECAGGGLTCRNDIPGCPEAYCCPSDLSKSSSPFCKPGCNGGAASACNGGDVDACAQACSTNPGDLSNPDAQCAVSMPPVEAGPDAPAEAQGAASVESGTDGPSDTGQGG
jgi:hypothetical protein